MSRRPRGRKSPTFDAADALLDATLLDALDLHGHTAAEATGLVSGFLTNWARRAPGGVVRIVTGKGRGSAGGAVLRPKVAMLLNTELRALVADWAPDADDAGYVVRLR